LGKGGSTIVCSTVSIQKVAFMTTVWAFCPEMLGLLIAPGRPSKKAILSAPPPNSGGDGDVEMVIVVVESMCCVAM
jgi:hypothetical protein